MCKNQLAGRACSLSSYKSNLLLLWIDFFLLVTSKHAWRCTFRGNNVKSSTSSIFRNYQPSLINEFLWRSMLAQSLQCRLYSITVRYFISKENDLSCRILVANRVLHEIYIHIYMRNWKSVLQLGNFSILAWRITHTRNVCRVSRCASSGINELPYGFFFFFAMQ